MKYVLLFLLLVLALLSSPKMANAQRLAECDSCGYCQNREAPQNWNACATCLYPSLVSPGTSSTENKTLIVDDTTNRPPAPQKGAYYTQLGCLDVSAGSFSDPTAAGGLLNFILNRLLFPISGTLAFLAIIYGAFLLITGQNNPEQIGRGKAWIYGAIIGVLFILGSVFIVQTIGESILKIPGFSN